MGASNPTNVVALDTLFDARRIWRGQPQAQPPSHQPTGFAALDALLPSGGWPEAALSELLLPLDGIGELRLLWPTLARLSNEGSALRAGAAQAATAPASSSRAASPSTISTRSRMIVLIAPPYLPLASAWAQAGVRLKNVQIVQAEPREVLWTTEQCLRSAACAAVLCWPQRADDRALRRLQMAAETGQALAFAMRPVVTAANPSPAALRIAIDARPAQLRVLKCRGGNPPARPIPWPAQLPSPALATPAAGPEIHSPRPRGKPIGRRDE